MTSRHVVKVLRRRITGLDTYPSPRRSAFSKPAGPLSQDKLSLGGSLFSQGDSRWSTPNLKGLGFDG